MRIFEATFLPLKAHPVFCFLAGWGKKNPAEVQESQPKVNKNNMCFSI